MKVPRSTQNRTPLDGGTALVVIVLALGVLAIGTTGWLVGRGASAQVDAAPVQPTVQPTVQPIVQHVQDTATGHDVTMPAEALAQVELVDVADLPALEAQLGYAPSAAPPSTATTPRSRRCWACVSGPPATAWSATRT